MGLKRSLLIPLLGLLIFLVWLVFYSHNDILGDKNLHALTLKGTPAGGDFQVDTHDGKVSLSDFNGKVVVLYFGYATCPDVCPSSLSKISLALQNLSQKERSLVKTLFISIDPKRDTVNKLTDYVHYYNGSFIGATATQAELDKIAKQYGVIYHKVKADTALGYWFEHTASVYVIDTTGKIESTLPQDSDVATITESIKDALITEGK